MVLNNNYDRFCLDFNLSSLWSHRTTIKIFTVREFLEKRVQQLCVTFKVSNRCVFSDGLLTFLLQRVMD